MPIVMPLGSSNFRSARVISSEPMFEILDLVFGKKFEGLPRPRPYRARARGVAVAAPTTLIGSVMA